MHLSPSLVVRTNDTCTSLIAIPATTETSLDKPERRVRAAAPREAPSTRVRILRVTLELIGREGIGAVSNRRIAAAAEVSLGSLTYHFPSQAELLRESLLLFVGEEVDRLETIASELRSRRPPPNAKQITAEVQRIVAESAIRPEHVAELELHLRAFRDPSLQGASQRCFEAYRELAAAALAALGVPSPARHARAVVALMYGMGLQRIGTGNHDAEGVADALVTIVRGAYAER
jgi:DNA-binding transcriptional regulator YbjK